MLTLVRRPVDFFCKVFRNCHSILLNPGTILAVGAVLLFTVTLSGIPIGNDESNWLITGRLWVQSGLLPYRDMITNKAPGIFIVDAFSYALFHDGALWFVRLLSSLATLLTGFMIYVFVRRIGTTIAAALAAWMYILLMPLDVVDGAFVSTETFMNLFRIVSFWALFAGYSTLQRQHGRSLILALMSGLCFGAAVAFKQIALFDAFPLLLSLWFLVGRDFRAMFLPAISLCFGALLATLISVIPILVSGGTIGDYWAGAWVILFTNVPVSTSALGRLSGFVKNYFEHNLFPVLMGMVAFLGMWKRSAFMYAIPLLGWILTDFIAYNAQGQYFNHHHKVFLLSGCIVFGLVMDRLLSERNPEDERNKHRHVVLFILMLILYFVPFQPDYFYAIRNSVKELYPQENQLIGERLRQMTDPADMIYIWGDIVGPVYFYADRRPASRQYLQALLTTMDARAEVRSDIDKNKPRVILVPHTNPAPPWLSTILTDRYVLVGDEYGFTIYKRNDSKQ